jgi:hypothetical protein
MKSFLAGLFEVSLKVAVVLAIFMFGVHFGPAIREGISKSRGDQPSVVDVALDPTRDASRGKPLDVPERFMDIGFLTQEFRESRADVYLGTADTNTLVITSVLGRKSERDAVDVFVRISAGVRGDPTKALSGIVVFRFRHLKFDAQQSGEPLWYLSSVSVMESRAVPLAT